MVKKLEVNLREPDESEYGWAYLNPYLEKSDGKKRPMYQALELIFREHEMYKAIAENMSTMHDDLSKQLEKIQKEVHFTLLRSGDAEKSARTLLHLWNSYNFDNNVINYLPMDELLTPPLKRAMNEVAQYYKELAAKKRSKNESLITKSDDSRSINQSQTLPEKKVNPQPVTDDLRSTFSDWAE